MPSRRPFGQGGHMLTSLGMPLFPSVHGFFKQWLTGLTLSGGANLRASPSRGTPHRCIQPGLGRTQGPPVSSRSLAPSPALLSHQPARTGGSLPSAATVSSLSPRTTCSSEYGQHDSGLPYSRQVGWGGGEGEWVCSAILTPVWDAWFHPQVDLFATTFNHRLPTFVLQCQTLQLGQWTPSLFHGRVFWLTPFLRSPFCCRCSRNPGRIKPHSSSLPSVASSTLVRRVALSLPCTSSQAPPSPRALLKLSSGIAHASPGLLDLHARLLCGTHLH